MGNVFADAIFERGPVVFDGIEVWGVRRPIAYGAAHASQERGHRGRLMETGVIEKDDLAGLKGRA